MFRIKNFINFMYGFRNLKLRFEKPFAASSCMDRVCYAVSQDSPARRSPISEAHVWSSIGFNLLVVLVWSRRDPNFYPKLLSKRAGRAGTRKRTTVPTLKAEPMLTYEKRAKGATPKSVNVYKMSKQIHCTECATSHDSSHWKLAN